MLVIFFSKRSGEHKNFYIISALEFFIFMISFTWKCPAYIGCSFSNFTFVSSFVVFFQFFSGNIQDQKFLLENWQGIFFLKKPSHMFFYYNMYQLQILFFKLDQKSHVNYVKMRLIVGNLWENNSRKISPETFAFLLGRRLAYPSKKMNLQVTLIRKTTFVLRTVSFVWHLFVQKSWPKQLFKTRTISLFLLVSENCCYRFSFLEKKTFLFSIRVLLKL